MSDFQKFIQFTKVEDSSDGDVLVWGIATQEMPDLDNERCIYAAAVPVYQAWSDGAKKRTEGAGQEVSLGPIRLQHSLDIGGKATKIQFDDEEKRVLLGSKPLNEQIRQDVKDGFYTGYSQGGSYAWRKCSQCGTPLALRQGDNFCPKCQDDVIVDYALKRLSEVSYVDSPCSGVGFDYVKNDGSRQLIKFQRKGETMPSLQQELQKHAAAIHDLVEKAKEKKTKRVANEELTHDCFAYVGDPEKTDTWKLAIKFSSEEKTKRHIRNALARFDQTKGIPEGEKAKVKAKIVAAAREHGIEVSEAGESKARQEFVAAVNKVAETKGLQKSLWDVGELARVLQSLAFLYENAVIERDIEDDESPLPEELKEILDDLTEAFIAMAEEEARELAARTDKADTTKGGTMSEDVLKAAKKTLAHHFAKSAAHHEKMAAHHEKKAEHHQGLHELHKAHHEKTKAAKADVGTGAEHGPISQVLENQQEFHKAAAGHHEQLAKCHMKCAKAHSDHAEHHHKMSEEHDAEEHEKTVKAIKAEAPEAEPTVKKAAPPTIDADVAAEAEAYRNTPEYKESVKAIAKAHVDEEIKKLRGQTVIPDGVSVEDHLAKVGDGKIHVARPTEKDEVPLVGAARNGSYAGL